MTLRLSSTSSSASTTTVEGYLKQITDDTSISLAQKGDCLKTLAVVLRNLIDASKGGLPGDAGIKYRTLKTDNPKLQARLFCAKGARGLLTDASLVGMVATEATLCSTEAPTAAICDAIGLKVLPAITVAQKEIASRIQSSSSSSSKAANTTKKAKLGEHNSSTVPGEKLSEKQKARRLMEEKQKLEKQREKEFRREMRAKIAADKLVRETDENWRPSVSAAADKTGTGLLTFRDRHGE